MRSAKSSCNNTRRRVRFSTKVFQVDSQVLPMTFLANRFRESETQTVKVPCLSRSALRPTRVTWEMSQEWSIRISLISPSANSSQNRRCPHQLIQRTRRARSSRIYQLVSTNSNRSIIKESQLIHSKTVRIKWTSIWTFRTHSRASRKK